MEKASETQLPPIFKFSDLCNILPFYGWLSQWVWLLKQLNSKTAKIWGDNEGMFMKWGHNFRDQKYLNVSNFWDKAKEYFKYKYMFYKHFYINQESIQNVVTYFLPKTKVKVWIFEKSDKAEYDYKLSVISNNLLFEYLPVLQKEELHKQFATEYNCINNGNVPENIRSYIQSWSVIAYKGSRFIKLVRGKFLLLNRKSDYFEKIQIEQLRKCTAIRWCCKPSILLTANLFEHLNDKIEI